MQKCKLKAKEVEDLKKNIDNFILNNSSYLGDNVFDDKAMQLDFGAQLKKYTQLEIRKRSLNDTSKFLIKMKKKKALKDADFGSQGQISTNYSNNFIGEVKLQQNKSANVQQDLITIVDKEIERLEEMEKMLSERIDAEKSLAKENLRLEDEHRLYALNIW